jgi:serine protease Do
VIEGAKGAAPQASATAGYSDIAEQAVKSVVNIASVKVRRDRQPQGPFFNDPFFRFFFRDRGYMPRERRERALGSGVIVTADGYILTNNHMVADAAELLVVLQDGRELTGKTVGADEKSDVAVIKVEATGLTPLPLGDSAKLRLGEVVLAIGNPFGLSHSVSMGIVSALGRANVGINDYEDFIQTDAAINPGNSGGALINTRGELVGINSAIFSRSGGYEGIGFAIPVNMARAIMDSLVKFGKVERGFIGVNIQDLRPEMADQFGLTKPGGALISDVSKGSPADDAGLERGDVVIAFSGQAVNDSSHFRNLISQTPVGTKAELTIVRDKKQRTLAVTIGRNPNEREAPLAEPADVEREESDSTLGLTVANLTRAALERFDLPPDTQGVLVVKLIPDGRAAEAGLRPGDVIMEVNRAPVNEVGAFKRALDKSDNKRALLLVNRGGSTSFVMLRLK